MSVSVLSVCFDNRIKLEESILVLLVVWASMSCLAFLFGVVVFSFVVLGCVFDSIMKSVSGVFSILSVCKAGCVVLTFVVCVLPVHFGLCVMVI